jgi:hypothetical protein
LSGGGRGEGGKGEARAAGGAARERAARPAPRALQAGAQPGRAAGALARRQRGREAAAAVGVGRAAPRRGAAGRGAVPVAGRGGAGAAAAARRRRHAYMLRGGAVSFLNPPPIRICAVGPPRAPQSGLKRGMQAPVPPAPRNLDPPVGCHSSIPF